MRASLTERTSASLNAKALWVTWEHQRRNAGIAERLGVPLLELDLKYGRVKRYAVAAWRTWCRLRADRPGIIFVQNPSVVLTVLALAYGKATGARVVVDAHNAAIIPLTTRAPLVQRFLAGIAVRHAFFTIVTNDRLARVVRQSGGCPYVLPDRIPPLTPLLAHDTKPGRQQRAVFVCTFAPDEPYMEVLEAAALVGSAVTVAITGNAKSRLQMLTAAAPSNVVFTGYLPEEKYISTLQEADVIINLTTRDDCLVCGAYEGIAVERPLILSDTPATREYFSRGVRYTDNSAADIAQAMRDVLASKPEFESAARQLKEELKAQWDEQLSALIVSLNDTAKRGGVAVVTAD